MVSNPGGPHNDTVRIGKGEYYCEEFRDQPVRLLRFRSRSKMNPR